MSNQIVDFRDHKVSSGDGVTYSYRMLVHSPIMKDGECMVTTPALGRHFLAYIPVYERVEDRMMELGRVLTANLRTLQTRLSELPEDKGEIDVPDGAEVVIVEVIL